MPARSPRPRSHRQNVSRSPGVKQNVDLDPSLCWWLQRYWQILQIWLVTASSACFIGWLALDPISQLRKSAAASIPDANLTYPSIFVMGLLFVVIPLAIITIPPIIMIILVGLWTKVTHSGWWNVICNLRLQGRKSDLSAESFSLETMPNNRRYLPIDRREELDVAKRNHLKQGESRCSALLALFWRKAEISAVLLLILLCLGFIWLVFSSLVTGTTPVISEPAALLQDLPYGLVLTYVTWCLFALSGAVFVPAVIFAVCDELSTAIPSLYLRLITWWTVRRTVKQQSKQLEEMEEGSLSPSENLPKPQKPQESRKTQKLGKKQTTQQAQKRRNSTNTHQKVFRLSPGQILEDRDRVFQNARSTLIEAKSLLLRGECDDSMLAAAQEQQDGVLNPLPALSSKTNDRHPFERGQSDTFVHQLQSRNGYTRADAVLKYTGLRL